MAANPDNPVEFIVTPRFDVFYALYALTNPIRSTLQPWKEKTQRRLPRDFDRVARRVAPVPLFWPLLADALRGTTGQVSFDQILSALQALPPEDLLRNVLSGIFHDPATVEALTSQKKSLRQVLSDENLSGAELLTHFGLRPYTADSYAASAMIDLLAEPESFRNRIASVLEMFWQSAFEDDWESLESTLHASRSTWANDFAKKTVAEIAEALNLPLKVEQKGTTLRSASGTSLAVNRIERSYIIPSAFNTRRWWARYDGKGKRSTLYFPVAIGDGLPNYIASEVSGETTTARSPRHPRSATTTVDPELVFRALGDTTRYAIASILARTPTTSADLARSLGVSKPTITHHVQNLRSAGLIEDDNASGPTLLRLNRDVVGALSDAAVAHLFASSGDLRLATTRKKGR